MDFKEFIFLDREINGGNQVIYKFGNGFGASVVRHPGSYGYREGLYELAVLKFNEGNKWSLCYTTEITDDVLGWLSFSEVEETLNKVKELDEDGGVYGTCD